MYAYRTYSILAKIYPNRPKLQKKIFFYFFILVFDSRYFLGFWAGAKRKYLRWSGILYPCQINDEVFIEIKCHFKGLYMGISVFPLHWQQGHTNVRMEDFGYLQIAEMLYR